MAEVKSFDLLVIGGGSGGIASARRATQHGAKVCLIESGRLGGTCVNVGCVPKKIMYSASQIAESIATAHEYGFVSTEGDAKVGDKFQFKMDWTTMKQKRDFHVKKLNDIYANHMKEIHLVRGKATFVSEKTVEVDGIQYTGTHVLIAVGGYPAISKVPGAEHCINSDGFFDLEACPKKVCVLGAGYIAVELGQILQLAGAQVTLVTRYEKPLRHADHLVSDYLLESLAHCGVTHVPHRTLKAVELDANTGLKTVIVAPTTDLEGKTDSFSGFDVVLYAAGRQPNTQALQLDKTGVVMDKRGYIPTDEFENTNVKNIYAVGDVTGKVTLTPVAVAAGRKLMERLFNNQPQSKLNYVNVPSVIFSHPPIAVCGMTEKEAVIKYTCPEVTLYVSSFRNLFYSPMAERPWTYMKIVCAGSEQRVVGVHMIGKDVDEILQGFGVAIAMGATKAQFDSCVAIHPVSAEEMVTMTTPKAPKNCYCKLQCHLEKVADDPEHPQGEELESTMIQETPTEEKQTAKL